MQMEQTDSEDMARALASYKKTGSQELRNQLVVHYLPIVRSAAVQLRAMAGSFLEQEDLADQGVLALTGTILTGVSDLKLTRLCG